MKNSNFLTLPAALLAGALTAQNLQPFFAPAQSAGQLDVRLCPMENVLAGAATLVTFGVPFPRGSVVPADLAKIRVLDPATGAEIAAHVETAALWRSTVAANDQKSVRVATVQIHRTFAQVFPAKTTLRLEWGGPARTLNVPALTAPRTGWHLATSGTFVAADSVFEPDVYVLLPRELLCAGALKLARMLPYDAGVPENRENPAVTDAISAWPGYTEMDHAEHNFLFTLNNDDDPLVTPAEQNHYKTDFEPWLYDRSAAMFVAYFRSGNLYDLRQAVRNGQFYLRHLYPPGTVPSTSVGVFDLKIPDPAGYVGGNGAMYSYAECLAYSTWLTGDPKARTAVDWVVNAHENQDESPHWTLAAAEFTERHTAFRLLANTIGFEVTGNATYRDSMLRYANDFVWHQNGAGGQMPVGAIDGGLYHLGSQHGDGTWTDFTASSWMTVVLQEAMIRAFALTEKPEIGQFIRRTGNFFQHATKFDDQHIYDTYLGGAPLWYGDYMMLWNGTSDERDGTEVEHALETADAAAWASWFAATLGQPDTALTGLAKRLYFTYDQGVNHWTRPQGPAAGKAAFRVSPPRKYGWEYRPSGSFSWLMAQLEADCALTAAVVGDGDVCDGEAANYSTAAFAGAMYFWTVAGGAILSGQGTNAISVKWGAGGTGEVKVLVSQ